MPAERYRFAYGDDTPYSHAVGLLRAHGHVEGGLVIDVGCGYGAIAEPVRDLGFAYLGLDLEPSGIDDLHHRGFTASVLDVADPEQLRARLTELVADRPLAALVALDAIEHLTNGPAVLAVLHEIAIANGRPPLIISIPNVTHLDLAAKLLVGRFDVTPTGLLDETHVAFYSPARLSAVFEAAGWCEIGADDFELVESDQHFPKSAPMLAPTPLHELLERVRRRAAPGATTNQFVRAYAPVVPVIGRPSAPDEPPAPFLSVILSVGDAADAHLEDVLVALEAQLSTDFELVALVGDTAQHSRLDNALRRFRGGLATRTRVLRTSALGASGSATRWASLQHGVREARGRYVCFLDERCVPFATYVSSFAHLEAERPGALLRVLGATQRFASVSWPKGRVGAEPTGGAEPSSWRRASLLDHLFEDTTPLETLAMARACFGDLGLGFDPALGDAAARALFLDALELCGLVEDTNAVAVLRRLVDGEVAPSPATPPMPSDDAPLLLPAGARTLLASLRAKASAARDRSDPPSGTPEGSEGALASVQRERDEARAGLAALRASTSWRITAPLRAITGRLRG